MFRIRSQTNSTKVLQQLYHSCAVGMAPRVSFEVIFTLLVVKVLGSSCKGGSLGSYRSIHGGADLGREGLYNLIYKSGESYMGECGIKAVYCSNKERYFRLRHLL